MDWALFLSALISSTLLPGGSEALLLYKLHAGGHPLSLVVTATVGNVLGSLITYGMGRLGNAAVHRRWLRMDERDVARAEHWFGRFGQPALLFAWLPVVGDPLCLVAGLLRSPLAWFVALVSAGKFGRYAVLAWLSVTMSASAAVVLALGPALLHGAGLAEQGFHFVDRSVIA